MSHPLQSENIGASTCPRNVNATTSLVVGIHLSGPNAKKSSLVILNPDGQNQQFVSLYEKIGSVGTLFSDERIIDILKLVPDVGVIFVDCPVTEPPCVNCDRPQCPGVVRCEDVAVGMMLAIEQQRGRKGGRKLRPLNPQNLRLWDAMYGRGSLFGQLEPTYSANLAPLVVRAKTLQRRLRSLNPDLSLRETNVPFLLKQLEVFLSAEGWASGYRNFENGFQVRSAVLAALSDQRSDQNETDLFDQVRIKLDPKKIQGIAGSVETFHAFMAASMGVWMVRGMHQPKSEYFSKNSGWVELLRHSPSLR